MDRAIGSLTAVVKIGSPRPEAAKQACDLIHRVELARRLSAVAAVDVLQEIHASRTYYDHGHVDAKKMYAHMAGVSGAEAYRLDKIRRMVQGADHVNVVWRAGKLSVDKAALLGEAFANPRTRDQFLLDQKWFLKQSRRLSHRRLKRKIAQWVETHDMDGAPPGADPSHERRAATLVQDYFSKAWRLEASLGSLQGSRFNQILRAYLEAEFLKDWSAAEAIHGTETCHDLLARTHRQRMADALCQIAEDAADSDKPSATVSRTHTIVWTAETYEELLRRWVDGPARVLDPDRYNITDIDGHRLCASAAFADSLVASIRRVVQNAAGVSLDMSEKTRFFEGLSRLGVQLTTTECYWPGCHVPTSRCHIDHLRPAARGGQTEQRNGLPACPRHNRFKERGYTVTRNVRGDISITTPTGDIIPC